MNSISLHIAPLLIGSFDTTSVLIVSVMTIAFIISWAANRISILRIRKRVSESKEIYDILQHTLDLNDNYVLRLDLRERPDHAEQRAGQNSRVRLPLGCQWGASCWEMALYARPGCRGIHRRTEAAHEHLLYTDRPDRTDHTGT